MADDTPNPETLTEENLEDLLDATLGNLRKVFLEMQDPEWRIAVKKLKQDDPPQRALALRAELAVLNAIQELELVALQDVLQKMRANAGDLRAARKELGKAAENVEKVAETVQAVASVVNVLNKIVVTVARFAV